ncbi:MAG: GTP cyclohydrolase FolE2 [Thermodesulfobacteriaceae bacterium]|nr:GTP cyclohydrolase FolE2 [Thermodesulfobacteriaceae bacterium]MCX8041932.1 GTP cyclohydrolase FolE2 [Thermodesulfobacteriaceae bacterium]MDW8136356.1 GTP cyclohydrolase FolE2 [Thermodesulfobacterium sp.]
MILPDIQNTTPEFKIPIDKVGIKNLKYPIKVLDRNKGLQATIGEFNIYVDLPSRFKGTHMSRFVEVLNEFKDEIHIKNIGMILKKLKERLNAKSAHLEVFFPYFIEKKAPITNALGLMEYQAFVKASLYSKIKEGEDLILGVKVPVMTLCPCSKSISKFGAHNQRGLITIAVKFKKFIWLEELIEIAEKSASSPVYPILKRPDEKFVTEKAYENPKFVEDVARTVAEKLLSRKEIYWFSVEVENFESIHGHNAYAFLEIKRD